MKPSFEFFPETCRTHTVSIEPVIPRPATRVHDGFSGNHSLTGAPAEQHPLDYVTCSLAIGATGPAVGGLFKPSPLPPMRIASRQVTGGFERTGYRLTDAVGGHEQAFFVFGSGREELQVLLIKLPPQRSGIGKQRDKGGTTALALGLNHAGAE